MRVDAEAVGERAGARTGPWAGPRPLAGARWLVLPGSLAWLVMSVTVPRFTPATAAVAGVLLGGVFLLGAHDQFLAPARCGLPPRRRLAGYALAATLGLVLAALLASLRGQLSPAAEVLAVLLAVIVVALAGGLAPAVLEAIAGSLLLRFFVAPQPGDFPAAKIGDAAVLGGLVAVAMLAGFLVEDAARRTRQAARAAAESELLVAATASILHGRAGLATVLDRARVAFAMESVALLERAPGGAAGVSVGWMPVAVSGTPGITEPGDAAVAVHVTDDLCLALRGRPLPASARRGLAAVAICAAAALGQQRLADAAEAARLTAEADRMRTALLAAVGHDLRTPLAAAKAAVSCLRSRDAQLTADDQAELLATAEESLDRLAHLAAGLLDVSRLQAGAVPVCASPADLGDIIARSLDDLGPQARAVMVDISCDLPEVMADPAITERVVVNLAGNALRYSPAGSPLVLRARAHGDRVELRVIDCGPGIPEADKDRAFAPFQRLGDTSKTTGVGLGLAVARGLTEAMGGTLEPEETPGGGLTMAISLPAALRPRQGHVVVKGQGFV